MLQSLRPVERNSSKKKPGELGCYGLRNKRMSDVTEIFDGNIRIYRTTNSGDVYQMRMYVAAERRYVRKTLKTRDKEVAISLAQKEFIFYQAKILNGEKIFSVSAEEFRNKYLEYVSELVTSGQLSKGRETNIKTFTKHWMMFVKKATKVQNIDKKFFQG